MNASESRRSLSHLLTCVVYSAGVEQNQARPSPWADEVLVLTNAPTTLEGSIDKSLDRTIHIPSDDQGAAWREAFRYARGAWLFFLTSDDSVSSESGQAIRDAASSTFDPRVMARFVQIRQLDEHGRLLKREEHLLLVRNCNALRTAGPSRDRILAAVREVNGLVERADAYVLRSRPPRQTPSKLPAVTNNPVSTEPFSRRPRFNLRLGGHEVESLSTLWPSPELRSGDSRSPTILVVAHLDRLAARLDRNQLYRYEALARHPGVVLFGPGRPGYRPGMSVDEAAQVACPRRFPDVVFHGLDFKESGVPLVTGLATTRAVTAIEVCDSWAVPDRQCGFIRRERFDLAIMFAAGDVERYRAACPGTRTFWFPNAVNTAHFHDHGHAKDYDVILYGNLDEHAYPLRSRLARLLSSQDDIRFRRIEFPGYYPHQGVDTPGVIAGVALSREINRSWLGIATSSIYRCLMMKYLEVATSGALVAGDMPLEAAAYFGEDFLEIRHEYSDAQVLARIRACLADKADLLRRIRAAQDRIKQTFSTDAFASRLINLFAWTIAGAPSFADKNDLKLP